MNGRISDLPVTLPLINGSYRHNCDVTTNDHGKEIMNICRSFSCFPVNNLDMGQKHFDGDFTFRKGDRKSQNDIVLANQPALSVIRSFTIHKEGWNPSDHAPVSIICPMSFSRKSLGLHASKDILTERVSTSVTRPKRISRLNVDWTAYKTIVENDFPHYRNSIDVLSTTGSLESLDAAVARLSTSLYRSANVASNINVEPQEIDDATPSPILELANEMCKIFHQSNCTLEEFEDVRKEAISYLRTETTSAERKSWSVLLKENNSKALWEKIDWNGSVSAHDENEFPDLEDLRDQFQQKSKTTDSSTLFSEVQMNQYVSVLDDDITIDEIDKAHRAVKEDKSTADGWVKGMLTNIPVTMLYIFQIIYNSILQFHIYPSKWRTTIVNAIFKNKGTRKLAQYYRGISIVHLMAKVFDIVILNRFKSWFTPHDQQTAYQEEKGCPDHVFLLRCVIAHAKKLKEKLFIISIDFDGAFDRVSRKILLQKLSRFGAGTVFILCIASMYLKTDNVIFQDDDHICYSLYAGIKQGLPLSPLLFLFYVNDIFPYFQNLYHNTTNNIYEIIHVLMHADDFTLTASTRSLATKKLQSLLEFCNVNAIIPQYTKCEFTVINGDENDAEPLTFGDRLLKYVGHITLLGSHLTGKGTLFEDLKLHIKVR